MRKKSRPNEEEKPETRTRNARIDRAIAGKRVFFLLKEVKRREREGERSPRLRVCVCLFCTHHLRAIKKEEFRKIFASKNCLFFWFWAFGRLSFFWPSSLPSSVRKECSFLSLSLSSLSSLSLSRACCDDEATTQRSESFVTLKKPVSARARLWVLLVFSDAARQK